VGILKANCELNRNLILGAALDLKLVNAIFVFNITDLAHGEANKDLVNGTSLGPRVVNEADHGVCLQEEQTLVPLFHYRNHLFQVAYSYDVGVVEGMSVLLALPFFSAGNRLVGLLFLFDCNRGWGSLACLVRLCGAIVINLDLLLRCDGSGGILRIFILILCDNGDDDDSGGCGGVEVEGSVTFSCESFDLVYCV